MRLKKQWLYLLVAAVACLLFIYIYGIRVLDPTYTGWLLGKGDLSQHYFGWVGFRNGDWQFPFGLTDQLAYPDSTSVIFTDSIPLLAVFFKLFRSILPDQFQYFGFWGIGCFILMGVLSVRILSRYIRNEWYLLFTSVIFMLTPVMIMRMYAHTALAGQWLILLAIDNYLRDDSEKKKLILWGVLGFLAASIHLYLLLMCGMILAGSCVQVLVKKKNILLCLKYLAAYVAVAGIVIALLGGFSSGMSAQNAGLGIYSLNLNGFFNSQGWSSLLPSLPLYGNGQGEGFNYLGAGVLVMLAGSAVLAAASEKMRTLIRNHMDYVISLLLICVVAVFFAASDVITLNDRVLINLPLPGIVRALWSVFRATGRVGWIVVYLVMIVSCVFFYRIFRKYWQQALIGLAVMCLQIYDLQGQLVLRHNGSLTSDHFVSSLQDETFWQSVSENSDIEHVILVSRFFEYGSENMSWSIADWALSSHRSLNDFYFARDNSEAFRANVEASLSEPDGTELFVFRPEDQFRAQKYPLHYYAVDGLLIGSLNAISDAPEAGTDALKEKTYEFGDNFVSSGADHDGIRELYESGLSYGPYWDMAKGTYHITISGNNLQNCSVAAQSCAETDFRYTVSNAQISETDYSFDLELAEDYSDVEIMIQNLSAENVQLDKITVEIN